MNSFWGFSNGSDHVQPQANQFRFYRMEIVPDLFGDWGLVREWDRVGRGGQTHPDWFDTEDEAKSARFSLHMKKAKRGYEEASRMARKATIQRGYKPSLDGLPNALHPSQLPSG